MYIRNKLINIFFNKFDFAIRFVYSRFDLFSRLMNKFLFWKFYTSNISKLDDRFQNMMEVVTKNSISVQGKICLELGPGNSLVNAYQLLMCGAKQVILVDKFSRYHKNKKQKEYFNNELEFIRNKYSAKDLFFLIQILNYMVIFITK